MAEPNYSVLELCKNRAGFEAIPQQKLKLRLDEVERELKDAGFEPLANAGILLVVRWEDVELSVFESGKLLFKTREQDKARVAMAAFKGAMGWGEGDPGGEPRVGVRPPRGPDHG